ncbi:MAG: metallopeptidase [Pirellulales bacterium]
MPRFSVLAVVLGILVVVGLNTTPASRTACGDDPAGGSVALQPHQPGSRSPRSLEGFTILVDDALLPGGPNEPLGREALAFLAAKLAEIRIVLPTEKVDALRKVTIVLDRECGTLDSMQYHPSGDWLAANGYPRSLEKCVHLPRARDVATRRNINEQPWVILHELAHAYHDQVLGFDDPRIVAAWVAFGKSGRGDDTLLFNGSRVRHYGLTDHKEFFAEMTEAYFGSNDFYPFNRAQLKTEFPEIFQLLTEIWGPIR